MDRTSARTSSASALLTCLSTLRMKCTRQRCQLAPESVAAMAALSPWWASLITSATPCRPRAIRLRRNCSQNSPLSAAPMSMPRIRRRPSAVTPMATTAPMLDTRPFSRTFGKVASNHM